MGKTLLVCVLVGVAALALLITSQHAEAATTYYVGPFETYTTIQSAVNAATDGDTIIVRDGIYNENVDVNKRLTIKSENGSANCIVSALISNDDVFGVTADYVNITGFSVENAMADVNRAGIYLHPSVRYCNISNNTASNNGIGIRLFSSSDNAIIGNTVSNNSAGIFFLSSSNNNTIMGNTASNNDFGIELVTSSNNNTITGNTAHNNHYHGIWLSTSCNNTVAGNTASNNDYYGIYLDHSCNNAITGNTANSNNGEGIYLHSFSNNNTITGNTAHNNNDYFGYFGITLNSSSDNIIYNNYFNNTRNVHDDGNNIWNITKTPGTNIVGGPYLGGNYWGDYAGVDLDGDGLGDTPYPILPISPGDNHPLMVRVHNLNRDRWYYSIQSAINDANDDDTIKIYPGTYKENLKICKPLKLIGDPVIDGMGGIGISVEAHNTLVENMTVFNCTDGIHVHNASFTLQNVIIDNCTVYSCTADGIEFDTVIDSVINNSHIYNNYLKGIYLEGSSNNNTITGNTAHNNNDGIWLGSSNNNTITGNTANSNHDNGIYLRHSSNNNVTGNTANSNHDYGIFLRSASNNNVTGNTANSNSIYGIFLRSASNNHITGNNASHNNKDGIRLDRSSTSNNHITGNTAHNNRDGISLYQSGGNNIAGNNASHNNKDGIRLRFSSGNTLTGNTASHNNRTGIYLSDSSNNNHITGNNASSNNINGILSEYSDYNNGDGISLEGSSGNTLTGNIAVHNNRTGIALYYFSNNTLTGNTAAHNNIYGIALDYSNNNTLTGNTAHNNNGTGIFMYYSSNNTLTDNTVNNNNGTGVFLDDYCNNNTITDNTVNNNSGFGIYLYKSCNNTINRNTAHNNRFGIYLFRYGYNTIAGNTIIGNSDAGIKLLSSSYNTIAGNTVIGNSNAGIEIYSSSIFPSSNNIIYNNYFKNTNNAFDDGNNTWNITKTPGTNIVGGPSLGGNYWSNYMGVDIDSDGLGDTQLPYTNSGGIQNGGDWHPLVSQLRRPKPRLPDPNVLIYFIGPHEWRGWYWAIIEPETLICFNMEAAERTGIVEIFYQVDSGFFMRYTECFTLPLGQHRLSYYGVDSHGASSNMAHVDINVVDTRAPVTTCTASPAVPEGGANGWYRSDVTLGLTAVDELSDVAVTYYKVDDDHWEDYTEPIMLAEDGEHTFYYYSVDTAGNKEEEKSTILRIDTANPVVNFEQPTHGYLYVMGKEILPLKHTVIIGKAMITTTVYDETSGIERLEFYVDDELEQTTASEPFEWLWDERIVGMHTLRAVAYDNAGNIASVEQEIWVFNI